MTSLPQPGNRLLEELSTTSPRRHQAPPRSLRESPYRSTAQQWRSRAGEAPRDDGWTIAAELTVVVTFSEVFTSVSVAGSTAAVRDYIRIAVGTLGA